MPIAITDPSSPGLIGRERDRPSLTVRHGQATDEQRDPAVLTPTGRRGRHARLPAPDATIPDPDGLAAGEELPADGERAAGGRGRGPGVS